MSGGHTPGPWVVFHNAAGYADGIKAPNARNDVAGVVGQQITRAQSVSYPSSAEGAANAHLIAASPDLLAALEGVLRVSDRQTAEYDAARAAIAKARGVK